MMEIRQREDVRRPPPPRWAMGEIESTRAREGLTAAQRDEVGSVRRAATWRYVRSMTTT